jgi:hypothetical protein
MKPGIITLEAPPDQEGDHRDMALRLMLDDLMHAGHVAVDDAELACRVWFVATRRYPESDIVLSRTRRGYCVAMEFRRNL